MHPRNRLFVTLGLLYGLLGGLLALVRLAAPAWLPGDAARAHAHLMLLGLLLMNIYGIGLHTLPRFAGRALKWDKLAAWQLWLANAGLPLMVIGWLASLGWLVTLGGALSWAAMALFAANIIATVGLRSPLG